MEILRLLEILKGGESDIVEFKQTINRSIRRDACAFANSSGGQIFLGVADDGTPVGIDRQDYKQKISDLLQGLKQPPVFAVEEIPIDSTRIVVISIQKSPLLISESNIAYIRTGTNNCPLSIEEVVEKSAESLRIFFDQVATDVPASGLNKKLIKSYLTAREKIRRVKYRGDVFENAVKIKALKKRKNRLFATNAGILCFMQDPQQYIGNSSVRLIWFDDEEMKTYQEQREFMGPLPKIIGELEDFFTKHLRRIGGFTVGFKRQEFAEYPFGPLREAVINAVIHRNYFNPADTRIFVFPSRIEIKNPGSFPPGVTPDNPEHSPRNPIIAQYFYDLGLIEKYGSGIKKIIRETKAHPLIDVEFRIRPHTTTVVFRKTSKEIPLDKISQNILNILTEGKKRSGDIAHAIGLSRPTVLARLKDLMVLGFVASSGKGPQTFYKLKKTYLSGSSAETWQEES